MSTRKYWNGQQPTLRAIRDADRAALLSLARVALCELARRERCHLYDFELCEEKPCRGSHWNELILQTFPSEILPYRATRNAGSGRLELIETTAGVAWRALIGGEFEAGVASGWQNHD